MKRILFVDDEQHILDGLRRMLRPMRKQWEMVFANGGEQALAEFQKQPFEVVVTDMRMPNIDGAQLLAKLQETHPQTVRIILSGYTELEGAMRAVPIAHQFLSKPCDANTLREVVNRSCQLQDLLQDELVCEVVGDMKTLPALPETYASLTRALADPDVEVNAIAEIVESDSAMCARILQLVNSAFFGLPQNVTSIERAVCFLGTTMIRNLVLSVELFRPSPDASETVHQVFRQLQAHSTLVATLARKMFTDTQRSSDAFMAGMLHDIGLIILASQLPDRFEALLDAAMSSESPLFVVEEQLHGTTHAEIGAYLIGLWGLPYPIAEAVANHHHPSRVPHEQFDLLAAVHVAEALIEARVPLLPEIGVRTELNLAYLEALGVSERIPEWEALADEHVG